MAFGIQVTLPNGADMVTSVTPIFYLDFITTPASGSRTYTPPQGKRIAAYASSEYTQGVKNSANVSVSGNTVTWSNVTGMKHVVVYAEKP